MARARPTLGITLEGPFFERDPRKTFRANIRTFMARVAEVAEAETRRRMAAGAREGAHTAPFIVGRTHALGGKKWAVTARVSVSTVGQSRPEAIRRQAIAAGRHNPTTRAGRNVGTTRGGEGRTHAFRDGKKAVEDAAQANIDKLLEGLT